MIVGLVVAYLLAVIFIVLLVTGKYYSWRRGIAGVAFSLAVINYFVEVFFSTVGYQIGLNSIGSVLSLAWIALSIIMLVRIILGYASWWSLNLVILILLGVTIFLAQKAGSLFSPILLEKYLKNIWLGSWFFVTMIEFVEELVKNEE